MKTVELQFRSHRILTLLVIAILPLTVIYMVQIYFGELLFEYMGVTVDQAEIGYEIDNQSIEEIIVREVNYSLYEYISIINDDAIFRELVLLTAISTYLDASLLFGFVWVLTSYIILFDPIFRGHYKVYMNVAGVSKSRFMYTHLFATVVYTAMLGLIIVFGFTLFLVRAGFPYMDIPLHLYLAFLMGFITYFLFGFFFGLLTRSVELSMLMVIPLILTKNLQPENPLLLLSPDMVYLYLLTETYGDKVSEFMLLNSLLVVLALGVIGIYLFLRGGRI